MKRLYITLVIIATTAITWAQAPQSMSYQAVIRDASNTLVTNQAVGMQVSILQGSSSGTAVYVETQSPTSNINGLISVEIGNGTVVSGTFNTIDWSNGPYFVMTETDPTGGSTYTINGTTQLLSVPYALHAAVADSVVGGVAGPPGPQGPQGIPGVDGIDGMNGADGADGMDGATGPQGPQGPIGLTGPAGADGADGMDGAPGPQGPQGIPGVDGIDGMNGADGADGMDGATGPQGPQGPIGLTGPAGSDGADGMDGAPGPQGPQGMPGVDGQGGVSTAGSNVTITGVGTSGDPYVINAANNPDPDPTNELQNLIVSATGDTLTISGGNFVIIPGISAANTPPAIGDFIHGGVVIWIDPLDPMHGLVVSTTDLGPPAGSPWGCSGTDLAGAMGVAIGTGTQNTIDIEAGCTTPGTAADLCANLVLNGHSDWFLPSIKELAEIYTNIGVINPALSANGGTAMAGNYWSSTEVNSTNAEYIIISSGAELNTSKNNLPLVRAVRVF